MPQGWHNESARHALAAKGIKTRRNSAAKKADKLMKTIEGERKIFIPRLQEAIDTEAEFELYDIMEELEPGMADDRDVVAGNVKEVLVREKLIPEAWTVLVPVGGIHYRYGEEEEYGSSFGAVNADFEIFSDPDNIVAYGTTTGTWLDDIDELLDLQVWITEVQNA